MFGFEKTKEATTTASLAQHGYWPAIAAQYLAEKKYARVIELHKEHADDPMQLLSTRLLYARALFHTGQHTAAAEQFRQALIVDPENLVALKYLGDISFAENDSVAAFFLYERVLELDPRCTGLSCELNATKSETTRIITMHRPGEQQIVPRPAPAGRVVFYTETMGDLYLAQGYYSLAATVYRKLIAEGSAIHLEDKLARVEEKLRERSYVSTTN